MYNKLFENNYMIPKSMISNILAERNYIKGLLESFDYTDEARESAVKCYEKMKRGLLKSTFEQFQEIEISEQRKIKLRKIELESSGTLSYESNSGNGRIGVLGN